MADISLDQLNEADLAGLGLTDPARSLRILRGLAGQGVTDDLLSEFLPSLFGALAASPDPDRALNNFARWTESVTSRYTHIQYLLRHPAALDIFFNVCGVSQLFSDILIRNPEYFEILANPGVRGGTRSAGAVYRGLSSFVDGIVRPELKLEAMRRFKQREILRIGTRDILEVADMPSTALEFSNLADACIQKSYEIGVARLAEKYGLGNADIDRSTEERKLDSKAIQSPLAFTVIGMGKLGGRELNYSSDIDLMFVCGEEWSKEMPADVKVTPLEYAHALAEFIINALAENLQNGHLFRVDMRLRPEGRFGALVRTLSSYRSYYESWAEPWERQSLLKARPVGGDSRLGQAFTEMVTPFVYRRSVTTDFLEAIRHNKRRIEQKAQLEDRTHSNVKVGYGGIRDIEFTVQLLQLELGGRNALLRTPTTLEALARLRQVGAIGDVEAMELAEDYQFLRTVEHRLQILYERQTQSLPSEPSERRLLARRLGYRDAEEFDRDYARRTERVHAHFERLFLGMRDGDFVAAEDAWRDLLENADSPQAKSSLLYALEAEGFVNAERAYTILRAAVHGSEYGQAAPDARQAFLSVTRRLVASCGRAGDPDAALRGLEALASASPNPAALYRMLSDSPELTDRLAVLSAGSPAAIQTLARHMEWLDMLVSDEIIEPEAKTAEEAREELEERTAAWIEKADAASEDRFINAVALYIQRERLRIAARDLWSEVSAMTVARELTAIAEGTLAVLLKRGKVLAADRAPLEAHEGIEKALASMALIGLGKLGGRELGYGSDWDILAVYEPPQDEKGLSYPAVTQAMEYLLGVGQQLRARGAPVEVDARLRPEGKKGALVMSVEAHRDYYFQSALTWEKQVLTKARFVAGNNETAAGYMLAVTEAIYSGPLSEEAVEEIRAMKRRIEKERLKPEERETDVKLGNGGLNDIEFTAQLLQMKYGTGHRPVRSPETVEALHALAAAGAIPPPEALRLAETYTFWMALRNRLTLRGAHPPDVLPADPVQTRAIAIGLGFADTPAERAEESFRRQFFERMADTRHAVELLFYGER